MRCISRAQSGMSSPVMTRALLLRAVTMLAPASSGCMKSDADCQQQASLRLSCLVVRSAQPQAVPTLPSASPRSQPDPPGDVGDEQLAVADIATQHVGAAVPGLPLDVAHFK